MVKSGVKHHKTNKQTYKCMHGKYTTVWASLFSSDHRKAMRD